jgi:cytidylate kinase
MIIAIDGPSASGKSTLGRMLARALKLLYLDTGSMYRAVALAAIDSQVDPSDAEAVTELANGIDIDLQGDPDSLKVLLAGRDVTERIRKEDVTAMSSVVSVIPGVRRAMVARQRAMGLTAVPEERAERRYKEDQMTAGSSATLTETLADITERDKRDSTRTDSPLKVAEDAIVIDSTGKNIEQVFAEMMERIR